MHTRRWIEDTSAQRAKDKAQVAELKEAFRDVSLTQDNTSFWDGICIALGCKPANDNR